MEFHISKAIRTRLQLDDLLFSYSGNVLFANLPAARSLALKLQQLTPPNFDSQPDSQPDGKSGSQSGSQSGSPINAGALFAMGLIDELAHALIARYRAEVDPSVIAGALAFFPPAQIDPLLLAFVTAFPTVDVYRNLLTPAEWLAGHSPDGDNAPISNREVAFEELMLLHLANRNPAFAPFKILFEDTTLPAAPYKIVTATLPAYFETRPALEDLGTLFDALLAPILAAPDSITAQLDFIQENWASLLGEHAPAALRSLLLAAGTVREEEIAIWSRFHPPTPGAYRSNDPAGHAHGFRGDEYIGFDDLDPNNPDNFTLNPDGTRTLKRRYHHDYQAPLHEYEAFSADQAWMPNVVLIAKSTYVWLEQLSKKYQRHIHRLDQIPTEELELLAARGITALWLIGLWQRSRASQTIKRLCGNPEAVASAYSLQDYLIAEDLGGESAYQDLRDRAGHAGLRLASDMVPNHMGIDSTWVVEHPEWFLSRPESPFPVYSFEGPDLSNDSRVEIKLEDHYYNQSDAAVVFRLRHHREGVTRFTYHGNDGTTFAWNDTAQLDYSKAQVREHVIQVILDVARRFPIIRFDAAMVLAKRHVQRLWFPLPGAGGSIPSRAEDAISEEQFEQLMPLEFWREVVDRVAVEVPGTLLLAEAFWLLEGYFVRTLGMHRVYNSAFMNMLRDEENAKYRSYLKKTLEFDPDILKRYVNFMSNPDEKTAREQFGDGDKYFGTSVLLVTLPGLPMFGHGQIEGFTERYGMDFKQAKQDESPNPHLVERHNQQLAPLLRNRAIFAESTNFTMYDFWLENGTVDENVFAYSNNYNSARSIILYNNTYASTRGTLSTSVQYLDKYTGQLRQRTLAEGLALPGEENLVIAYRDTVQNLEFLRRASDLRTHGLTFQLNGYQHIVLLGWRELRSTAEQPWDRLCDSLAGAGIQSVDQAMTQIRLRPVYDALRQAINPQTLASLIALTPVLAKPETIAGAPGLAPETWVSTDPPRSPNHSQRAPDPPSPEPAAPANPASSTEPLPSVLSDMVFAGVAFVHRLFQPATPPSARPETTKPHPHPRNPETSAAPEVQPEDTPTITAAIPGATPQPSPQLLHLQHLSRTLTDQLQRAAPQVSPSADSACLTPAVISTSLANLRSLSPADQSALLAFLSMRATQTQEQALHSYDTLELRSGLAEAFHAFALEGDSAWRAAASTRLLLEFAPQPLRQILTQDAFWASPDTHWLAGIDPSGHYIHKESFEALLQTLAAPAPNPSEEHAKLTAQAHEAGYNIANLRAAILTK